MRRLQMELEKKPHEICAQNELQDLSNVLQCPARESEDVWGSGTNSLHDAQYWMTGFSLQGTPVKYTNLYKMKTDVLLAQDLADRGSTVADSKLNNHSLTYPSLRPAGANGLYMDGSVLWQGAGEMYKNSGYIYQGGSRGLLYYNSTNLTINYYTPPNGSQSTGKPLTDGSGMFW